MLCFFCLLVAIFHLSLPVNACSYGQLRLSNGYTDNEGRVEICINNVWGTVCDDYWTDTNAAVACRQLGYSATGATYRSNAYYGSGTGNIFLDNVRCTGSESTLLQCSHNSIGSNDCSHSEDVSVICSSSFSICTYGSLRLRGGYSSHEGRLEICINNVWGTVCDDYWTDTNAQVACRQLGYSTFGATYHSNAYYGQGTGSIFLDNVQCTGYESTLLQCSHSSIGWNDCSHSEDVSVVCSSTVSCSNGTLRLRGGTNSHEGRVEMCINGKWGTVCDDDWYTNDAKVVCKQLGYPATNAVAYQNAHFGAGTGDIVLDNVQCIGSEPNLLSCAHNIIGDNDCSHFEDAGVSCQGLSSGLIAGITIGGVTFLTLVCVVCLIMCGLLSYHLKKRRSRPYVPLQTTVDHSPSPATNIPCNPTPAYTEHPPVTQEQLVYYPKPPEEWQPPPPYSFEDPAVGNAERDVTAIAGSSGTNIQMADFCN